MEKEKETETEKFVRVSYHFEQTTELIGKGQTLQRSFTTLLLLLLLLLI
jgi:hypothetical protein